MMLDELATVVGKIKELQTHLVFLRSEELRAKREAWNSYDGPVSHRDKYVTYAVYDYTTAIWEAEAELANLIEDKWLIKAQLDAAKS